MVNHERIVQILYRILRLDGAEFITELYRQLLNREPDLGGLHHHVYLLKRRVPKLTIISAIIQSEEAEQVYRQMPNTPVESNRSTVARIISQYILASNLHFVHALFYELVGRNPEQGEIDSHTQLLIQNVSRIQLLNQILVSEACQQLLFSKQTPLFHDISFSQTNSNTSKCIGFFVGYTHAVEMDGEGIGRFLARLVHGLLLHNKETVIYVVTTIETSGTFERLFNSTLAHFSERFLLVKSNSMDWINRHVPVDVWIVPFIGLENAIFLKKPYILCLHDLVYMHFQDMYYGRHPELPNRLNRFVYPMADKATAIVSLSNYVRITDGVGYLRQPEEKTYVIRLASPIEEYATFGVHDDVSFREKHQLYGEYIVFPSVLRLHKNHCRLIEAFIRFRQTPDGHTSKLQLVFTDTLHTSILYEEISAIINSCPELEIRNSIHFIGRIHSTDLPSLYKYAIGTIVPTLSEGGCPVPILESLGVGTPVAVSRIEVTKEAIPDIEAFLPFDPYSVEEMANSIQLLWAHNRNLLPRQLSALSASFPRSWSDVAHEYFSLVQHVALQT